MRRTASLARVSRLSLSYDYEQDKLFGCIYFFEKLKRLLFMFGKSNTGAVKKWRFQRYTFLHNPLMLDVKKGHTCLNKRSSYLCSLS